MFANEISVRENLRLADNNKLLADEISKLRAERDALRAENSRLNALAIADESDRNVMHATIAQLQDDTFTQAATIATLTAALRELIATTEAEAIGTFWTAATSLTRDAFNARVRARAALAGLEGGK